MYCRTVEVEKTESQDRRSRCRQFVRMIAAGERGPIMCGEIRYLYLVVVDMMVVVKFGDSRGKKAENEKKRRVVGRKFRSKSN